MEMQRMNGTVQNLKEAWQKMPGKTKKMIAVIAAGTIILAAAGLLVLNIGTKKGYSTLFTGMSSEDAQAVVSLLQDEGVDYRYNDKNGSVQVMSDTVHDKRMNDCLPPILFSAIFKLLKVLPDTELDAC